MALVIGLVAGLVTSIPMLGPVVLLLFAAGVAANRASTRRAMAFAAGAALAEGAHVALVVFGLAPALLARAEVAIGLRLVSGCVLMGMAVWVWTARPSDRPERVLPKGRAFGLGVALVALNPGFTVTWLAVTAFISERRPTATWGWPFVVGAVLGIMTWFALVMWLAQKVGPRLVARLTTVRAVVAVALGGSGLWLVAQAIGVATD